MERRMTTWLNPLISWNCRTVAAGERIVGLQRTCVCGSNIRRMNENLELEVSTDCFTRQMTEKSLSTKKPKKRKTGHELFRSIVAENI